MDPILCIALLYGDTFRMAADQRKVREDLEERGIIAPSKFLHEHPAEVDPDQVIAQPDPHQKPEAPDNNQVCTNWGCGKDFEADRNDPKACCHHSGRFEFGSEHGLWPEGWSCCRRAWDELGCALGKHVGQPRVHQ